MLAHVYLEQKIIPQGQAGIAQVSATLECARSGTGSPHVPFQRDKVSDRLTDAGRELLQNGRILAGC